MEKMLERLNGLLMQAGIVITDTQKTQLVQLVELLHKWNKAYNLTSVRDPDAMLVKHILDSLVVSPHLHGERFIDVGTGPGLPGLPLAIINPDKQFVLLDSLGKRINFIRQVIQELGLTNVTPVKSRVEEYQPDVGFDCVLSRAFASLEDMLSWCHHLPSEQGSFLALKGQYPEQELAQLPANIRLVACHELRVPELEGERHLLEFKHIQPE